MSEGIALVSFPYVIRSYRPSLNLQTLVAFSAAVTATIFFYFAKNLLLIRLVLAHTVRRELQMFSTP